MPPLSELLQPAAGYGWLYVPSAILLGALHGLEPGHSKTMMAAFIVAIRGSIRQAMLLGASAALSHTAVVWLIVLAGLQFGKRFEAAAIEPVMQLVAGLAVLGIALWMLWRTWRNARASAAHARQHAHDDDDHDHDHDHHDHDHGHHADDAFGADEHARQHALAMQRTLGSGPITNARIALFGLTGGLVPWPASVTVRMVCLQLRQFVLGNVLVLCFGVGLALTLIVSGIVAALGVRHATRRFASLESLATRAPYLSGALMLVVSLYMLMLAWRGLSLPHPAA